MQIHSKSNFARRYISSGKHDPLAPVCSAVADLSKNTTLNDTQKLLDLIYILKSQTKLAIDFRMFFKRGMHKELAINFLHHDAIIIVFAENIDWTKFKEPLEFVVVNRTMTRKLLEEIKELPRAKITEFYWKANVAVGMCMNPPDFAELFAPFDKIKIEEVDRYCKYSKLPFNELVNLKWLQISDQTLGYGEPKRFTAFIQFLANLPPNLQAFECGDLQHPGFIETLYTTCRSMPKLLGLTVICDGWEKHYFHLMMKLVRDLGLRVYSPDFEFTISVAIAVILPLIRGKTQSPFKKLGKELRRELTSFLFGRYPFSDSIKRFF